MSLIFIFQSYTPNLAIIIYCSAYIVRTLKYWKSIRLKFVYSSILPHVYKLYKKKPIFAGGTEQVILISCQLWLLLTYMFFLIRRKWHGLYNDHKLVQIICYDSKTYPNRWVIDGLMGLVKIITSCKSQFVLVIFSCYATSIIDLSVLYYYLIF